MKPRIFIGSSAEQLRVAKNIQESLQHSADSTIWPQGIFEPSKAALDSLVHALDEFDFGVFIFTPDDILRLRKKQYTAVRDNVLFELGLFIGHLGKERNFWLLPEKSAGFRLPSDLVGFTPIVYNADSHAANRLAQLGPVCNQIERAVEKVFNGKGTDAFLSGTWTQNWHVDASKHFTRKNPSEAIVQHIGNRFRTTIEAKRQAFRVDGKVERDSFITGTWTDAVQSTSYFGAFQLAISPMRDKLLGEWVGFNGENKVKSGKWEWTRVT